MFGEFIWFLNKEWQNVSVKGASDWSAHTCCAPLPALCLKHRKHTFYLTCCFVEQFSSRVVIVRSICCSSVRCSLSSSSPDGCCCQVVDHPGSEELVSITLLPFCVYLSPFFPSTSSYPSCFPALHSNVGQRLHTQVPSRQARMQAVDVTLCLSMSRYSAQVRCNQIYRYKDSTWQ